MSTSTLRLEWVESATRFDRARWDRLAGRRGFYLSQGWLALQEGDPRSPRSYVVAMDPDGRLCGALPVDLVETESNNNYRPESALPSGMSPPNGPVALLGGHGGYRSGVLLDPDLSLGARSDLARALVSEARTQVEARGYQAIFMFHTDEFLTDASDAEGAGTPLLARHEATLTLPGDEWQSYLAGLSAARRRKVSREEARFAEAGYDVLVGDLGPHVGQAGALLAAVQHRYRHDADPAGMSEMLREQVTRIPGHVAFMCRDGVDLVGFILAFRFGQTLFMRAAGFDYERLRGASEYFNLGYYRPVRWAYEHGVRELHFGIGALEAKVHRGAALDPVWAVPVGWQWSDEAAVVRANRDRAGDPESC